MGDRLHQRRRTVRAEAARHITVVRRHGRVSCIHRAICDAAQSVIGVCGLAASAVVQQGGAVLVVVGEGRGIGRVAAAHLLSEGGQVVVLVVSYGACVIVRTSIQRGLAHGAVGRAVCVKGEVTIDGSL